jgi:pyridoxal phosphate enzyme (YggS family)
MIKQKYILLLEEIEKTCRECGRDPKDIKVVIASKYLSIKQIETIVALGHKCFGENKLQDALEKLKVFPELEWHFIGHLQSNKAKMVCENFSFIQSVDSLKLLHKLQNVAKDMPRKVSILLQVNITRAESQFGFLIDELELAYKEALLLPNLQVKGLMMIGEKEGRINCDNFFIEMKYFFDRLQKNYRDSNFTELSMGMSEDFRQAIRSGSTMIRIGRYLIS